MDSNQQQQIKIISEYYIKPKYEVEASKQPYYLGPIDLLFLSLGEMQKGLLFHNKPKNIKSHLIAKLQNSVSESLVHFYPLAGRLSTRKFYDEHAIWIYVDCINSEGARVIHAHAADELSVCDLISSTDVHPIVSALFNVGEKFVVNHDGHTRPLLSIQVTELIDGVFIGFTMNHSVADGTSLWHFISTLSEIFVQLEDDDVENNNNNIVSGSGGSRSFETDSSKAIISRKPIFNPFFPKGYGPIIMLPYLEPEEFITRIDPGKLRERIFHFSPKAISSLKAKANEECGVDYISSFQALTGFLWKSITRIRNIQPDHETSCTLIINWRARLNPPFSQQHFGNYLAASRGKCKVGELVSRGLGWAAMLVHLSVKAEDDIKIRQFLSSYSDTPFVERPGAASALHKPNNDVSIAGSPRFDMYGPEFGLGKAVAVLAGYANKDDGKVTANPGREGGGSVDLEVCLKTETMNALELDDEFLSFVTS